MPKCEKEIDLPIEVYRKTSMFGKHFRMVCCPFCDTILSATREV